MIHHYSEDQQVPSTSSSCALTGPMTLTPPQTLMSHHGSVQGSPFRVSNANPLQKVRNQCGIRNPDHLSQWMNNQNGMMPPFQGEMGTCARPPSRAPSTVSCRSGMTGMSAQMSSMSLGAMSQLSINTQITEVDMQFYQPQVSSASSSVENYQPAVTQQQVNEFLMAINNSLMGNTQDKMRATNMINQIRERKLFHLSHGKLLSDMIHNMFLVIKTTPVPPPQQNPMNPQEHRKKSDLPLVAQMLQEMLRLVAMLQAEPHVADVVDTVVEGNKGEPIVSLCRLLIPGEFYTKNAMTALWVLLQARHKRKQQKRCKNTWFYILRAKLDNEPIIYKLTRLALYSDINYTTARACALTLIKHLQQSDEGSRELFEACGGIRYVVNMIDSNLDYKVLSAALKLLLSVVSTHKCYGNLVDGGKYADALAKENGVEILAGMLTHGCPVVLRDTLNLMASISDVKIPPEMEAVRKEDTKASILSVLRLLGANDPMIAMHATAFLDNICANKIDYKRTLIENRAIVAVYSIIGSVNEYLQYLPSDPRLKISDITKVASNIVENSMECFVHLTSGDDPAIYQARHQLTTLPNMPYILLNVLVNKDKLASKVMKLLNNVFSTVPDFRKPFLDQMVDSPSIKQVTNLGTAVLRYALNGYRKAKTVTPAAAREHDLLIQRSVQLLHFLADDKDIRRQMANCLVQYNQDLLELVWTVEHEHYRILMLRFLDQMTNNGDGAQFLRYFAERNPNDRKILLTLRGSQNQEIAYRCNTLLCRLDSPIPSSIVTSSDGSAPSCAQPNISEVNLAEAMHPEYMS